MEILASLGSLAVGVIILYIIVKLLALPFKLVWNGIIGAIMLWLANLLGGTLFGVTINITIIKALIAGFFGIPGAAAVIDDQHYHYQGSDCRFLWHPRSGGSYCVGFVCKINRY